MFYATFTYNDEGLRLSTTINGATTTYLYDGSVLMAEYTPNYTCVYIYDESGAIIGVKYISTSAGSSWQTYFFEKNMQGDVIAVYSDTGTKLVSYRYDAWGNVTTTYHNGGASTLAANNPIRYRSYYFDTTLQMYYLQSRYYDAKICRFINADSYVSTGQGLTGYNMFAYCNNNPVNYVDPFGELSLFALFVVSTVAFSIFAFIPLSIMDGLSYEDSKNEALFNETFGKTEADFIFYETEINDVTLGNKNIATRLDVTVGACSLVEKYGDFELDASIFTAETSVNLVGGGAGAYFCGVGASRKITIFNKEISVGIELNCGAGFEFSIGPKTEIGLCIGFGPSFSIDWDP